MRIEHPKAHRHTLQKHVSNDAYRTPAFVNVLDLKFKPHVPNERRCALPAVPPVAFVPHRQVTDQLPCNGELVANLRRQFCGPAFPSTP